MFRLLFTTFMMLSSTGAFASYAANESRLAEAIEAMTDKPTFHIKCQLRYAMDCESLRREFYSVYGVIERAEETNAMVKVLLTDETTSEGIIVHSKWSSREDVSMVDFELPNLLLPTTYDSAKIQTELLNLLVQGLIPHIRVKSDTGLGDVLIASLKKAGPVATTAQGPFYTQVDLSGYSQKSGIGAKNADGTPGPSAGTTYGSASVTMNYSTDRVRVVVAGSSSYSKNSFPGTDGAPISASNLTHSESIIGVYSMNKAKRWNVAIYGSESANPGSNLDQSVSAGGGVEYNLVPFRIDQPYEFRVRTTLSEVSDRLVMLNERGNLSEKYQQLGAQLYVYWRLMKEDKLSLSGSLSSSKDVTKAGYYSFGGNGSMIFNITHSISLTGNASYSYSKKNIRFPGTPDFSNPAQTAFQSGYAGGTIFKSIGVTIKMGKGSTAYGRDRRFN